VQEVKENKDLQDIDIIQDEFIFLIDEFCQLHKIDDMVKESQNRFNAALSYIYTHKIKNTFNIKNKGDLYNSINVDVIEYIYNNIFISLCNIYNKEISISSFCYLIGVSCSTFENWLFNDNQYGITGDLNKDKLNNIRKTFLKNIQRDNENSLQNLLTSGKVNPVGVLAVLNHSHGWNLPGVSREVARPALTAENLPKLSNNLHQNEPLNCLPNSNNSEYVKSTQNQGLEQL
jgi:hypothetical protein